MAKDRQWNNQGGSSRDGGRSSKGRIKKPEDPFKRKTIDETKESDVLSFRLVKPRKPNPNYGQFGDAVWDFDLIPDDPIRDLDDPYRLPDLSTDKIQDIRPFPENENISKPSIPNPNRDKPRENKAEDLLPYSVGNEYELIVKFKKVRLTISSGQAYAARNRLNQERYDRAIVIESTQPIILNTSIFIIEQNTTPRTVNVIQLKNGLQEPIWALYNWLLTKAKVITDNSGKNPDIELLALNRESGIVELPRTVFSYNSKDYGLFYADEFTQPYQVCMHARNDVFKFEAGNPKDFRFWSVLNANEPFSLCTPNIPTVSVKLAPGSASELEAGSAFSFILDVTVDPDQDVDTIVEYETTGSANPGLYEITGADVDVDNLPVVIIPSANNKQILIQPFTNSGQVGNRTIIFTLKDREQYIIDEESVTLTIKPKVVKPKVSIKFAPTSLTSVEAGSGFSFILEASSDIPLTSNLLVEYETLGTANPALYTVTGVTLDPMNVHAIEISTTGLQQVLIEPLNNPGQVGDRTIVFNLKPSSLYDIDEGTVLMTITPKPIIVLPVFGFNSATRISGNKAYIAVEVNPVSTTDEYLVQLSIDANYTDINGFSTNYIVANRSIVILPGQGVVEILEISGSIGGVPNQVAFISNFSVSMFSVFGAPTGTALVGLDPGVDFQYGVQSVSLP